MARASDSEWTRWIEEAKARDIHEVARQFGAQLKRTGNEWIGPCPVCGGRDRFSVNPQKRVFNCRGAEDGGGSTIDLAMHVVGCDFVTAVERINGTPRPDRSRDETPEDRKNREQFHSARAADYARRAEEERIAIEKKAARDEAAVSEVIQRATPITGTHAEAYLRECRGLTPSPYLTGDLRFVQELDYWGARDNGSGETMLLARLPALIAIIRDFSGEAIGVAQTYLDEKEPKKWQPIGSPRNSPKKIRGRKAGGMIRLGRPEETIAISEGWENALAWHQLGLGPEEVMLAAAVDLGNLAGKATGHIAHKTMTDADGRPRRMPNGRADSRHPGVILPPGIKSVIIIADNDSEWFTTHAHLRVAVERWLAQDLQVEISWPPKGMDYNQYLLAGGNHA